MIGRASSTAERRLVPREAADRLGQNRAVLSVILATSDPYGAAERFVSAGWRLVFATPQDGGDPLACVALADAEVMLGTDQEEFLPQESREHRGAGVEVYIRIGAEEIEEVHERHARAGVVTSPLAVRQWGERAFHAEIEGYRFLVAATA